MYRMFQTFLLGLAFATYVWARDGDINDHAVTTGQQGLRENDMYNGLIRNYLNKYVEIQSTKTGSEKQAMETVKLLIVQSWIFTLSPERKLLDEIITVGDKSTIEQLRQELEKKIKSKGEMKVADDFIQFYDSISEKIRGTFEKIVQSSENDLVTLQKKIDEEKDDDKKADLEAKKNGIMVKQDEADILASVHDGVIQMAIQSFVLDFIENPQQKTTFVMSGSYTKERTFNVPAVKKGDFVSLLEGASEDEPYEEEE